MTLTKSLAACGVLLTVASPALAAESSWYLNFSQIKAKLASNLGLAEPADAISSTAVATTAGIVAPAKKPAAIKSAATKAPSATTVKPKVTTMATAKVATPKPAPAASSFYSGLVAGAAPAVSTLTAWWSAATPSATGPKKLATGKSSEPPAPVADPQPSILESVVETLTDAVDAAEETLTTVTQTVTSAIAAVTEPVVAALSPDPAPLSPPVGVSSDNTAPSGTVSTTAMPPTESPASDPAQSDASVSRTTDITADTGAAASELGTASAGGAWAAAVIGGTGATYYVDYQSGNNANSGTSSTRPWKHAPGDTLATGGPATVALAPGDTVRFKGGVNYRGAIVLKQGGVVGNPVIYTGTGFGTGSAIWDGADPVTSVVPCPGQSACGGATNWASLMLVTFKTPVTKNRALYDSLGSLYEAQSPVPADPFWDDNLDSFAVTPVSQAASIAAGRVDNAALAAAASGQKYARVAVWIKGNLVVERAILSVVGSVVTFDNSGIVPYTDRDGRIAIIGSTKSLTKPGLWASLGEGTAVVYPRSGGGTTYMIGSGRSAFQLAGKSNVTIHGFKFTRGTAGVGATREGLGVYNISSAVSNITIQDNSFANFSMQNGYGVVMLNNVATLKVTGNRLTELAGASGMRFGPAVTNLLFERNVIRRIGRTGLFLGGVSGGTVRNNVLSEMQGVHGNGISLYESNRNVAVSGNCVFASVRPLTFKGSNSAGVSNNLTFSGNIFVTSDDGRSSVYSWGGLARDVTFTNNVALGPKAGLILNPEDSGITVTRNRTAGVLVTGGVFPSSWSVVSNVTNALYSEASAATLKTDSCSARGYSGTVSVSAL